MSLVAHSSVGSFRPITAVINFPIQVHLKACTLYFLHPQTATLIWRKGKALNSFADLKNDKINAGNLGASLRAPIKIVLGAFDMQINNFALAAEL